MNMAEGFCGCHQGKFRENRVSSDRDIVGGTQLPSGPGLEVGVSPRGSFITEIRVRARGAESRSLNNSEDN